MTAELAVQVGTEQYRRGLRGPVRGLWSGAIDLDQAYDMLLTAIENGLTRAWHAGLAEVGILPAEMTPEERMALRQLIAGESQHIYGLLTDVEEGNKAAGGKLGPQFQRLEAWVTRALDASNRAKLMAAADPKLKWVVGPTKEHCTTCFDKLQGKVKRASTWRRLGIQPQSPPNPMLECGGWNCLCSLQPTDEPMSKGPLPKVP